MHKLFVINKKEDTKRLETINKTFKRYDLNIVEAINHEIGWKGCFLSHKKCLTMAKNLKMKYIIVIEDDCKPTDNFDNNLNEILIYLNNNTEEWDIFLGGVTNVWCYNNLIKLNTNLNLININKGKTAHLVIYNEKCYDFFLNHHVTIPIDKCWHRKLSALTCIPFIATQSDGNSSIEKKYVNYSKRFEGVEKNFKNIINNDT